MRLMSPNKIINLESNLLNLPNSVSNKFISYFKTWVDVNFQRFEENIKLYVPTTENSEVFSNFKKVLVKSCCKVFLVLKPLNFIFFVWLL